MNKQVLMSRENKNTVHQLMLITSIILIISHCHFRENITALICIYYADVMSSEYFGGWAQGVKMGGVRTGRAVIWITIASDVTHPKICRKRFSRNVFSNLVNKFKTTTLELQCVCATVNVPRRLSLLEWVIWPTFFPPQV